MTQDHPDHSTAADQGPEFGAELRDLERDCQSIDPATYNFEDLAAGTSCIQIRFGQNLYTLRRTRTGRLVLNK
jgi:hemin uptake protein HemP